MKKYSIDETVKQINLFDERFYAIKDKGITHDVFNVTGWLSAFPKGLGYDLFLMRNKDPYAVRDEAGQIGTEVHDLIERTLKGETVKWYEGMDIVVWERYLKWCLFWKELNEKHEVEFSPEFIEFITYDLENEYAGTVDLLVSIDKELVIIDWKTGSNIFDTALLQISAYAKSVEKQFEKVVSMAKIVNLNPSLNRKGFRVKELKPKEISNDFDHFLYTQKIYKRAFGEPKPKYRSYPMEVNLEYIKNEEIIK